MGQQLFANNAFSTLAGAITNVATTLSVQPGAGAKFPAPVGGDYFLLTLFQLIGGAEANHEVVKVTARAVDTLTIVRAQENTTARAWGVGDQVSLRATAGSLGALAQLGAANAFAVAPTLPTPVAGTNDTTAATTAFVTAAVAQAKADLIANSPAALDTLVELAAALGNDANFATTTATSLGNRLRVDVATQGLTVGQKLNALTNLGMDQLNNTSDANKPVSIATQNALNLKANTSALAAVATSGLKADVGLANVDNTSDVNKPLSTATQNALSLKAPLASPSFTGGVAVVAAGITSVFSADAAGTYVESQGSNNMRFYAGGTERLRIAAGGNLLIGTTTDNGTDKLQVNGTGMMNKLMLGGAASTGSAILSFGASGTNSGVAGAVTGFRLYEGGSAAYGISCSSGGGMDISANQASQPIRFYAGTDNTAPSERMRISGGGNLLIGTAADNGVDKLQVNGSATFNGGVNLKVGAGGNGYLEIAGNGNSPGVTSMLYGQDSSNNGYLWNRANAALLFATNGTERARIDASGNLLVGVTGGSAHTIVKSVAQGTEVLGVYNGTSGVSFKSVLTAGWNALGCAIGVGSNNSTGRSINAVGTINASGADYAEYMRKADGCGAIAKGQIVGVNALGLLTDKWADAVSFMVKTTNPSYVGGDTWGVGLEGDELEAARAKVDRIAFAGQVPCNVYNAAPGMFIVPIQVGTGIGGVALDRKAMTLDQYVDAVGIVQNILPDGRANIRVKVA